MGQAEPAFATAFAAAAVRWGSADNTARNVQRSFALVGFVPI